MTELFHMGGYGAYVWPAYGITLLVLVINAWTARRKHLAALQKVRDSSDEERPRKQPTVRQLP